MAKSPEEIRQPVAAAIGNAMIEWNQMQESFGTLFARLKDPAVLHSVPALEEWHRLKDDGKQRRLLRDTAKASEQDYVGRFPSFFSDIEWMCQQAGQLTDLRHDLAHAPVGFQLSPDDSSEATGMGPSVFFYHPRARKLEGKNLTTEYEKFRTSVSKLKVFARQIYAALNFQPYGGWPDRPAMPGR